MHRPPRSRHSNSGFAMLVLLALITAGILYFLIEQADAAAIQRKRDAVTTQAMADAKDSLIARSVLDNNRPGSLPCPDVDGDGNAEGMVGNQCPSYVGRLPWRTLKVSDLRDDFGEQLWYALSSTLRDDNSAQPINSLTPMATTIDGVGVAAIVFAPGPPVGGQTRPSNAVADYLDGANGDGDNAYVSVPGPNNNDRLLPVTQTELFSAVASRVAAEVRGDATATDGLQRYFVNHANTLPWAATIPGNGQNAGTPTGFVPYGDLNYPSSPWLNANGWFALAGYQRVSATQAIITLAPRSYAYTFPIP